MRIHQVRKAQGLCTTCGKPTSNKTRCKKCINKEKQRYKKRKNNGLCCSCNSKITIGTKCDTCRTKTAVAKRTRKQQPNYCKYCDSVNCDQSLMCYLKKTVRRHFTGVKINQTAIALKQIFDEQGGRCAYTGRQLTVGVDTTLDHIIPRARGGETTVDNVQWVCAECNLLKSAFLEDQFLNLVKDIYNYRIDNH